MAEGEFHESANLASLWKLPVLFLCENNRYAMGTALDRSEADTDLCETARSYRMPAESVDAMDILAVRDAARGAVQRVRGGEGPMFLELQTYRFRAHSMFDPELYRSKAEVAQRPPRFPAGRGRWPLRRNLCGQQGLAGGIRRRTDSGHAPFGVSLRGRWHWRGHEWHATDRRNHDRQRQFAGARSDHQ